MRTYDSRVIRRTLIHNEKTNQIFGHGDEKGSFVITMSEDLDCSGLPELDYEVCVYDEGHSGYKNARNSDWFHMLNEDIISMPDKWEYPWYAAWDLCRAGIKKGSGQAQEMVHGQIHETRGALLVKERPVERGAK